MVINKQQRQDRRRMEVVKLMVDKSNEDNKRIMQKFAQKFGLWIIEQDRYNKVYDPNNDLVWDGVAADRISISQVFDDFINDSGNPF
jgi:hypothetical protein